MKRGAYATPASAILLICGSVLCFALVDSIVKGLSARHPVPLLVWARWTVQALALAVWFGPRLGRRLLRTSRPRLQVYRSIVLLASSLCFFTSLKYLPLAEATAINYSTPVLVLLMAAFFLHERLTPIRIAFVLAGMAGMLLIVRPGTELFQGAALLALCAALFYSVFQIMTRKLAQENVAVMLFYPALICTGLLTLTLPWLDWRREVPWQDAAGIIAAGAFGTGGHLLFLLALKRAPVSALTPFTYLQLVYATLIGWLAFGDFPDAWTLAGMGVITGTGLLIALNERRRALTAAAPPPVADPTVVD